MHESVAEGISTSLQSCSPILQPHVFQEHFAFDLFSPSPSHLSVNDLGLTPPPGSQLVQPTDSTEDPDGLRRLNRAPRCEEGNPIENLIVQDQLAQLPKDEDALVQGAENSEYGEAIFDSELALQMLEARFDPRKRTCDEAFTEFGSLTSPEKKRAMELPHPQNLPTPNGTPSSSSRNSSCRPDQEETTANTPAGPERSQTPDSLFEMLCPPEDIRFSYPTADIVQPNVLDDNSLSNLQNAEQSTPSAVNQAIANNASHSPVETIQLATATQCQNASSITKQRFFLSDQDVIANADREMLKRVDPEPDYVSPYPVYGGPLGYLPSSPGIHVKCIEVAEDRISDRIDNLKRQVKRLTYERNKYKTAWEEFTTVDRATGKPKEQLLLEENAMIRRGFSYNRARVEVHRQEVEEWKGKFYDLARTYNHLLSDFQEKRIPTVASPPPGVSVNPHVQHTHTGTLMHPPATRSRAATNQPTVTTSKYPNTSVEPLQAAAKANPVTIDLTEGADETISQVPRPSRPQEPSQNGVDLRRSFQNKKYGWLRGGSQMGSGRGTSTHEGFPPSEAAGTFSTERNGVGDQTEDDGDDDLAREMEEELARAQ